MEFNFDVISADAHVTSMNLRIAREACVMAAVGVSACAICASTVATAERRLRSLSESQAHTHTQRLAAASGQADKHVLSINALLNSCSLILS